jgi:dihydrofolate synthase/folylpolyglutamate synthase
VGGLIYSAGGRLTLPRPVLPGAHQIDNAAVAIAALQRLKGFTVTELDIANGLMNAAWPGRLQKLREGNLVDLLPAGWELWLDGGHNAGAGEALAAHAAAEWDDRPLWLVCGMMNNKQAGAYLEALAHVAAGIRTVAIPGEENAFSATELADIATSAGLDAAPADDLAAAFESIAARQAEPVRILICGSLYLAGTVLSENA